MPAPFNEHAPFAGPRYRALAGEGLSLGEGRCLLLPLGAEPLLVEAADVALLTQCDAFKTLEQHAAQIASRGADLSTSDVQRRLIELVAGGLLTSRDDVTSALIKAARTRAQPPIATIAIPTRDRPESLRRCI